MGLHLAFEGEMARLFVRVRRVNGQCSWLRSLGVFISGHMDSKMAARSRWVRVVAMTYPQNIELPIKIIAINCQLKLIAGLEKRQLIAVSPTTI